MDIDDWMVSNTKPTDNEPGEQEEEQQQDEDGSTEWHLEVSLVVLVKVGLASLGVRLLHLPSGRHLHKTTQWQLEMPQIDYLEIYNYQYLNNYAGEEKNEEGGSENDQPHWQTCLRGALV